VHPGSHGMLGFRLGEQHGRPLEPDLKNYANAGKPGSPLLLFLPATGQKPYDYLGFLRTASSVGYHVLGLDYWNRGLSVARTCETDSACYTQVQNNRLTGHGASRFSHVQPRGSILTRLHLALDYLATHDAAGGWGDYLDGPDIDWNRVVLAGHSQGGGESAYIAHLHRVQGVLMFSSPVETDNGVRASWMMAGKGATPSSRMFGFDDTHDVFFDRIRGSWKALGMGAPTSTVWGAPHASTHAILSDVGLGTPAQAHGRTVSDGGPRGAGGSMRFRPIWTWMLKQVYQPGPTSLSAGA
jgi:hypothetical protein